MRKQFGCVKMLIGLILCLTLCLAVCMVGHAEKVVQIDYPYASEAMALHEQGKTLTLTMDGVEYSLEDRFQNRVQESDRLMGGKCHAVYEYTVFQEKFSVEDDGTQTHLATLQIDIPYEATLQIAQGNRRSGEYTLSEPITLVGPYTEALMLPRDQSGAPLLTDRVYLYSWQEQGETFRHAITVFIDYENYTALYPTETLALVSSETRTETKVTDAEAIAEEMPGVEDTVAELPIPETAPDEVFSANAVDMRIPMLVIVLLLGLFCLRMRKKKKAPSAQALPAAPLSAAEETLLTGRQMLEALRLECALLEDPEITRKAIAIADTCDQILLTAEEKPEKLRPLRNFLSGYLPTTVKMLHSYHTMTERGVSEENTDALRTTVLRSLDMMETASQRQLDSLYQDVMLDVSTDLSVLEQTLKRDGLLDSELTLTLDMHLNPPKEEA